MELVLIGHKQKSYAYGIGLLMDIITPIQIVDAGNFMTPFVVNIADKEEREFCIELMQECGYDLVPQNKAVV